MSRQSALDRIRTTASIALTAGFLSLTAIGTLEAVTVDTSFEPPDAAPGVIGSPLTRPFGPFVQLTVLRAQGETLIGSFEVANSGASGDVDLSFTVDVMMPHSVRPAARRARKGMGFVSRT